MSQEEDYDKELAELLEGLSPEYIRRVLDQTSIVKQQKAEKIPATVFRTITRHNKCLHCGSTWDRVTHFNKGEDFVVMNEKGKHYIVTVKDNAEIDVYHNHCKACEYFIRKMDRQLLEEQYLRLLKVCGHELFTASQKEKRRLCMTTRTDVDNLPNI